MLSMNLLSFHLYPLILLICVFSSKSGLPACSCTLFSSPVACCAVGWLPSVSLPPVSLALLAGHFDLPSPFPVSVPSSFFRPSLLTGFFWPFGPSRGEGWGDSWRSLNIKKGSKNIYSCEGCRCSIVNPNLPPCKVFISKVTESQKAS